MARDLIALIRGTKAQIAKLQAVLDQARAELMGETHSPIGAEPSRSRRSGRARQRVDKRRGRRKGSTVARAEEALRTTGGPMHVTAIIQAIAERHRQDVKKTTLVGNLARLVKAKNTFSRVGPNEYGLLEWKERKTS